MRWSLHVSATYLKYSINWAIIKTEPDDKVRMFSNVENVVYHLISIGQRSESKAGEEISSISLSLSQHAIHVFEHVHS